MDSIFKGYEEVSEIEKCLKTVLCYLVCDEKMVDSKRRIILPLFALLLLFFSVAYVSFSQNRTITGRVTSGTASINISVGASPSITTLSTLAAQDVSENTVKYVVFNFTAYDGDGAADLNSTAAIIRINRTGE